jgi:hypothetical protein
LAQALATGINDRPELYDRTRATIQALVAAHGLEPDEIVLPARAAERPAIGTGVTRQGGSRVLFRLDGDALGLRSIADAARVAAQFVPGADAFEHANFPIVPPRPLLGREWLDFGHDGLGGSALLEGWSEPEEWGVWSVAKSCSLRLYLSQRPIQPIRVEFVARASLAPQHPRLDVVAEVGDTAPQAMSFAIGSEAGRRFLTLDPAAVAFDGSVTIGFRLSAPRSLADLGISADVRPLGIGLEKLRLLG